MSQPIGEAPPARPPVLPQGISGWVWLAIKLVVSGGILAAALSRVDFAQVGEAIGRLAVGLYAAAIAALAAATVLAALRWALLTRRLAARIGPADGVGIYLTASFVGQVLPSTLGVDAVRAWLASRKYKPFTQVVSGVMADRAFGMLGLGVLILLGAPRLLFMGDIAIGEAAALAAGLLFVGAIAGFFVLRWFVRANVTGTLARLQEAAKSLLLAAASVEGAIGLALSVVVHALITLCVIMIAAGLAAPVSLLDGFTLIPAAMLIATIPVSINGWGLREGAMIACLGLAGVSASDAFVVSVLFGIGQFLVALPGAIYWLTPRKP